MKFSCLSMCFGSFSSKKKKQISKFTPSFFYLTVKLQARVQCTLTPGDAMQVPQLEYALFLFVIR